MVDDLDVSSATPLQDRVASNRASLRSGVGQDATDQTLAEAIDATLEACRPDNGERLLQEIAQRAQSEVFDADGPGDVGDMTRTRL